MSGCITAGPKSVARAMGAASLRRGTIANASQLPLPRLQSATAHQLHWLTISWRIDIKLVVLVYKCLNGLAPSYLADELRHPAESEFRRRLRSARHFPSSALT